MTAGSILVSAFGATHVGRVRPHNEDFFALGDLAREEPAPRGEPCEIAVAGRGPLFLVCDGLGGAQAGEVASELAAGVIWSEMRQAQATDSRAVYARLLRRAVRVANRRVWEEGHARPELRGMGTTVSAAGLVGNALVLAQVGDSRAYIARAGKLVQVTRDQSVVSALVQAGRLSREEARLLPASNMVLQALGIHADVEVALSLVELCRGDLLLMCSDGLHGPLTHAALANLLDLGARDDLRRAGELLVEAACTAGGPDNITAVVARFSGDGLPAPGSDTAPPAFIELDHMEEGERALANTSMVARRLAARAGIGEDPGPPIVPATGQHTAIRGAVRRGTRHEPAGQDLAGPATRALARRSRLGAAVWVAAVVVLVVVIWLLFGGGV